LGKIQSGVLKVGDKIKAIDGESKLVIEGKCTKIFIREGLKQVGFNFTDGFEK
jgi:GTP-binding protein